MFPEQPVIHSSAGQKPNPLATSQSPFLLLTITFAAIFIAEILVMLFLPLLPRFPIWIQAFIDAFLLIFLLFPMLYFFMFRSMKLRIKQLFEAHDHLSAEIIERKQVEAALRQSEKQLRSLSSQLLSIQERERRRVSRELHEELAQMLAALKLRLRPMQKSPRKHRGELGKEWEENLREIDQAIENLRRLSGDLSPAILEDLGFSAALQGLVDDLAKNHNLKVSFDGAEIDHLFPLEDQIIIYRIFQEAFSKLGKYAQASHLSLAVEQENGHVTFTIRDDGKGFDWGKVVFQDGPEKGLSLALMDERARMLGGTLHIFSDENKGTRLTLTIPRRKAGNKD
jgi:signal transduction histidine kinase